MKEFEELGKHKETQHFFEAVGDEADLVMLVLRAHLYSENLLERLIGLKLPRGDRVLENGNLSFHQKLMLVDSLDYLPDRIVSSFRNLNKLRNQCSHELNKSITMADITRIGSPLGKVFTDIKRECKMEELPVFGELIKYMCGYLGASCFYAEHPKGEDAEDKKDT